MFHNSTLYEDDDEDVVIETESMVSQNQATNLAVIQSDYHLPISNPAKSIQGYVLMLRNISSEAKEEDVLDLVLDYGRPIDLRLPLEHRTGLFKGYALVELADRAAAENLRNGLNGSTFMGNRIQVDFCFVN